jgi:hypothetical protein
MAFKLRSQSPIMQEDPMSRFKKPDPRVQKSLSDSNKKHKESMVAPKMGSNFEDIDKYGIIKATGQLLDPTGVSSYNDVKKTWNDGKNDYNDALELVGALPIIGKIPKFFKLAKATSVLDKVYNAGSKINKVTSKVNTASRLANQEKLTEAIGQSALKQSKSPLQKQKLSSKAAKAKAARDLAYAKSDDRTAKKAHAQRMHRKNPGKKGMDYDHEDGRFESVKQNRGNEGEGTKKESGKKYKVK